jgi:hypothetical protein
MPDQLTKMYDEWKETASDPTEFQAFQGGVTAGSVRMRHRALAVVQAAKLPNDKLNELLAAIGTLPDIG